jgi:hypothetical protein
MLNVIFTLDYEIHGNGEGDPNALMVEPTNRLLDLLDQHDAKLTIMADVAEILKFREHRDRTGRDEFHYDAIANQLQRAVQRGHDVQLHLHPSYFNATFNGRRWEQDWSEYNFAGLPFDRLNQIVRVGKNYLEDLLKPVNTSYECVAFRAANWAISPSFNVVSALVNNGIRIETSVFKHGRRDGIVSFDYSDAHSDLVPWRVDKNNICKRKDDGQLIESPIYCERRWIGAFLTPNRVYRMFQTNRHSIARETASGVGEPSRSEGGSKVWRKLRWLTGTHPWKADFNQCTGRQLARALLRASRVHDPTGDARLPFILIGHSKLFTQFNERSLQPFFSLISRRRSQFGFSTLASVNAATT